jgi:hypothetical protein
MGAITIEEYIQKLPEAQRAIASALDSLVRKALPDAQASIKWSQPVYSTTGPCCFIKAHKQHVAFGFWWGAKIDDTHAILEGSGDKMRHIKVRDLSDIYAAKFSYYVSESSRLNRELGDPTRNKA